jgi:surface protein
MKKLLITLLLVSLFQNKTFSQCTVSPNLSTIQGSFYPNNTSLAPNSVISRTTAIDTILLLEIATGTFSEVNFKIQKERIHDIIGLPAGFNWQPDYTGFDGWVNSGTLPNFNSTQGCVNISANQTAINNALSGGPNNNGIYPLEIELDWYVVEATCLSNCLGGVIQSVLNSNILNKWIKETTLDNIIPPYTDYELNLYSFSTIWKSNNPGTSLSNQITIPTTGTGYNYNVYWEDTSNVSINGILSNLTGSTTITFPDTGVYRVRIGEDFPRIYFNNTGDRQKILSIEQWGNIEWTSMENAFYGCSNLTYKAINAPDLTNVSSMNSMFRNANSFNGYINNWDVSNVIDMQSMFQNATSFNRYLFNWNLNQNVNLNNIFNSSGLDCGNYSVTLIGWDTNNPNVINRNLGNLSGIQYGTNAELARNSLISRGWTFNGDVPSTVDCLLPFFVTTWKSNNPGSSASNQITIPTTGTGYNYNVYWEDTTNVSINGASINQAGSTTLTFPDTGVYRVKIIGNFPRIYFNSGGDRQKILSIEQWGDIEWTSMENAFSGCSNLTYNATDVPNLTNVSSMNSMFTFAISFNGDINNWDVSNITDMSYLFNRASSFNQSLNNWDVSNVTNMDLMFFFATSFNQSLNNWDVSNLTDMSNMFSGASSFNQNLNNWDVSNVTNMSSMFNGASSFNQSLNNWDVSNVANMQGMFVNASFFDRSLSNWDVSNVTNMQNMFYGAGLSLCNYDNTLLGWSQLNLKTGVNFNAGSSTYSSFGAVAKQKIINDFSWFITDNGIGVSGFSADISFLQSNCDGDSAVLLAQTIGGNGNITYQWYRNDTLLVADTNALIENLPFGNYKVLAQDENNCLATDNFTVVAPAFPLQIILNNINNETCVGLVNGSINITAVGGVLPYTYTWSNGDTTQNIANLSAGNYQLIVTDALGCQAIADYTITSNPLPVAPSAFELAQAEVCQGQQNVIYQVSPVAGASSYQWTFPSGIAASGLSEFRQISLNFSDSAQSGNIVVRAVDNCGAGDSIVFAIIVNENPQANLQSQNETCSASNGSIILSNISGGSGNYMYLWNNGSADTQINQLSAGNYSVEIFDLNTSCTVVYNRTIVNLASPVINATSTQATCGNSTGSATVNIVSGNAPYSIVWSDGQTNAQATNLFANTYTVTVSDTNLCETSATVNIGNSNGPSIDSTFQFAAACASNCNGMAGVIVSGGFPPYTYEWNTSPVRTTPTISNVCAGNYTVVVKDMNQCAVSSSINIGVAGSNPNINGVITRPGGQLITNGDVRVELYRVSNQPGVYPTLEAQTLSNSGLFSLLNFDIGDFIVLARPVVSSSPNLENTLRTYFNFTNRWDTATVLNATCNYTTNFNITLLPRQFSNGNASINGQVFSVTGGNKRSRAVSVPDADIHIDREPSNIAVGNTTSDANGNYEINNLEPGTYRVTVDIPGLPMINSHFVTVTATGVDYSDRDFFVDSLGGIDIDSIPPVSSKLKNGAYSDWEVYPNPFKDNLNIKVYNHQEQEVELEIIDILGKQVKSIYTGSLSEGKHLFRFERTTEQSSGFYFVRMIMQDKVYVKNVVLK